MTSPDPYATNSATALPIWRLQPADLKAWQKTAPPAWSNWIRVNGFTAATGQRLALPDDQGRLGGAVVGLGENATVAEQFSAGGNAARLPEGRWYLATTGSRQEDELFGLGFGLDQYRFDRFKAKKSTRRRNRTGCQLVFPAPGRQRLQALYQGICLGRDLINTPANHMTPAGLEATARALAKRHGAKITVTKGKQLEQRFPAIHTVGRAAEVAPRLLDLRWGKTGPAITLIGKGITFDTGGLDLKPSSAMELMKKDMGGAATVLGLAEAIMRQGLRLRLRVLVPAAENAVSALSMRPLDVIQTAAGIPVEVGNTDAEGRLVLADALHLASSGPDQALILDMATLTGAARVAVGTEMPALFCNDDGLACRLVAAASAMADPLWRMPLHQPYERFLDKAGVALSSTGSSRYGGAITAALFLQRFLHKQMPWAHIDLMAWNLAAMPGRPRGGETMGLAAIFHLLEQLADETGQ